ncbi:MAG: helix-turn-helix transcriptional regulator [Defluviitaleaceae bacterium]|nr:helix-turn-helix transcriptional regulator [Defluviitaleaceae bacterium]
MEQDNEKTYEYDSCPLYFIQKALCGKWKLVLLWSLQETKRFNELHRLFPNITQAMLTKQLRELENSGFIHREVYKEIPPKVEYSLTDMGIAFLPLLKDIRDWGEANYDLLKNH